MSESTLYTASFVSTGLRFAVIASLILLSGCGGGSDSDSKPPDEVIDQCPVDDTKIEEGLCGCGIPDTDTDNDGTPDCQDACPEDPGTMPDEFGFCGDTGDSAIVVEGEELLLAINGAVLSVPANALEPGTMVTLTEVDPATLDTQPNGEGETRFTPVYSLTFSTAQLVTENLTFALDVTPPINARWDAHLKTEGGLATEGRSEVDWRTIFGDYDPQQSLLMIELGATADRFLIAGVSENAVTANVAAGVLVKASASPVSMAARVAAAEIDALDASPPEWNAHGWVILCSPARFAKYNNTKCNPLSPEYLDMVNDLAAKLYASDQVLTIMRFPVGIMNTLSETEIADSKNIPFYYDPDNRSANTSSISGESPRYFEAWTDPNNTDDITGIYYSDSENIGVDISEEDGSPFKADGTVIHELMHAVQNHRITNTWDRQWIIEGQASAVMAFAPSYTGPGGADFRYGDAERDWKRPLGSEEDTDAYKAAEYWLSWDSTLSNLPTLYDKISDKEITERAQFFDVDDYQQEAATTGLRDAYLNLIKSRNDVAKGYPHCAAETLLCIDGSCSTEISDFVPMSAQCLDVSVEFLDTCDGEPGEISVALEPAESNSDMKFMVDGVIYEVNTEVPFDGDARVWAINADFIQTLSTPSVNSANIVFRNVSPPCNVKLLQQNFTVVTAVGTGDSTGNGDGGEEKLFSYEDLSQESYHQFTEYVLNAPPPVRTSIEPLGLESWDTSAFATIEHSSGDVITASVAFDTDTNTTAEGGFLTSGNISTLAIPNIRLSPAGRSSVATEYRYKTIDRPAELFVTWGCGLTSMRLDYKVPLTFNTWESVYGVSTAGTSWECEPKQWTVPANREFRIRIGSINAINDGNRYDDEGGAYAIEIVPHEPVDP